jgi:hypothetical protein
VVQGNGVKNEDVLQQHKREDTEEHRRAGNRIAAIYNIIRAGLEEVILT